MQIIDDPDRKYFDSDEEYLIYLEAENAALAPPVGFAIELTEWPTDEEWTAFYEENVNYYDDFPE